MDNELLFILLILITVVMNIVKAVRKNKKKAAAPAEAAPEETGKQRSEWEKILRELMGEEEKQPQRSVQYDEEEPEPSPVGTAYVSIEEQSGSIRGYREGQRMQTPDYQSRVFQVESAFEKESDNLFTGPQILTSDYNEPLRDFDLRTAVIYSTLLKRPEV